MSKHLKHVRRERRKTDRARRLRVLGRHPTSDIKHKGAMALAAAAAIASGTVAYASPVRFDNPPGPGHFDWAAGNVDLDIVLDRDSQPGTAGVPSVISHNPSDYGLVDGTGASPNPELARDAGGYVLANFNSLDLIGAGANWGYDYSFAGDYGPYPTVLPEGVNTYIGVRFDLSSGWQYAWVGVNRSGNALDAFAWGYETEVGVSIEAGVPEPGTLALLAVGAVGLAGRRSRRQRHDN